MAILPGFLDSADHYNTTAGLIAKYTSQFFADSTADGRNGRGVLLQGFVSRTLQHKVTTYDGWAHKLGGTVFGAATAVWEWKHVGTILASVYIEADGTITTWAGSRNTLLSTSDPYALQFGIWYYFEVECTLSGATPIQATMTFRVNGIERCEPDTGSTGVNQSSLLLQTTTANVHFIHRGNATISVIDDVYMEFPDFQGDLSIGCLFPDGDVTVDWTGSAGGDQFELVNEQFPDDNTSYIESETPDEEENFDWENVGFSGDIVAVHYGIYAKKTDEGTRTFKHTVGPTGAFTYEADETSPGDSYTYYFICMMENPGTGLPWTQAEFNAEQFGVKLFS